MLQQQVFLRQVENELSNNSLFGNSTGINKFAHTHNQRIFDGIIYHKEVFFFSFFHCTGKPT